MKKEKVKPKNRCCGNCRYYEHALCEAHDYIVAPNNHCDQWEADE